MLPNGQPQAGDQGLDRTATWGRIYWGGALFWLVADVEIRERTNNRQSLGDALAGVLKAGGNTEVSWAPARFFRTADEAIGIPVLQKLHRRMGASPSPVDLKALWRRLGVSVRNDALVFDEGAELAHVRRAISARAPKD